MKRIVLLAGVVGMLVAGVGCVIDAGVDVGAGGGDACAAINCGTALAEGLAAQGDRLCDATSDNRYSDVINCACNPGAACADVCGDNLCADLGESADCGDCMNANCGPEHDACAND